MSASAPVSRSGLEIDLRLVVEHELAPGERAVQAGFDPLPLDGPRVHFRLEELVRSSAPRSLAWYIAVSAHLISVSASAPSSG